MTPRMTHRDTLLGRFLIGLIALCVMCTLARPAYAEEKYASYVAHAQTGDVYHARYADELRYPASLTKVMTLLVLFDAIERGEVRLDERMQVSQEADRQPATDLGVRAGQSLTVEEGIYALVTRSANDVAVVVAEHIALTEERFALLMTLKARKLGLQNTRFRNATGLPDAQQYTTARDMAKLAKHVLDAYSDYYHYFSTPSFEWNGRAHYNHNSLLNQVAGVDGMKTGFTNASGYNLMTSAIREGERIIVIVLGGPTSGSRNQHVRDLVEAAYTHLESQKTVSKASRFSQIRARP